MREILLCVLGALIIVLSIYESWLNNKLKQENAWHAFINTILIERLKRYEGDGDDE